jgi:GNAT superfamily N-acetyltransferase
VHLVVVKPEFRGQGIGRKLFSDLARYADDVGKTITLTPSSEFGGSKAKLRKFYKSLGFVDNKGRKRNYEYSDTMYRPPKSYEALEHLVKMTLLEIWNELY